MSPDADYLAPSGAQLRAQARGRGDAAVGDVERAVPPGEEAGRVEQLAHAEVGAVAVRSDSHHVTRRVAGGQPAGLELGGVERAVAAEAAACTVVRPVAQTFGFCPGTIRQTRA